MAEAPARKGEPDKITATADVERLLADDTLSVHEKIDILDARERALRDKFMKQKTVERAAERDDADAYHLLNEVLGALRHLRDNGNTRTG